MVQLNWRSWKFVVYLIGCDHQNAQTYLTGSAMTQREGQGQADLKELILAAVARYQLELIAEESNADILHRSQRQSVVYDAALISGITHRFCDPTPDERSVLSIEEDLPFYGPCPPREWEAQIPSVEIAYRHDIAHRWPVRECFWIDRLGDEIKQNVLFVCGDAHRWTFRRRLEARNIKVNLIAKRVGAKTLRQDYFEAYREVRRKGFPPRTGCFCVSPLDSSKVDS
jgi:hypothetical protein